LRIAECIAAVAAAGAAVGCSQTSAYERCRFAAALNQDPGVREVAYGNCEQMANREVARKMHDEDAENYRDRTEKWTAPPPSARPPAAPVASAPPAPATQPPPPSRCVVWIPSRPGRPTPLFPNADAVLDVRAAIDARVSDEDLTRLFERLGGVLVPAGTKCRFLEMAENGARVRLLEGEQAGLDGWLFLPRSQTAAGGK
jgi:hypothetical protein